MTRLTARQTECLKYLLEGLSSKQIAQKMFLSEETVNEHIAKAQKRLSAKNRLEAVVMALKKGLIKL